MVDKGGDVSAYYVHMKHLILGIALGCLVSVGVYAVWQIVWNPARDGETVFCTQEAKQCPDGSYVGRTGPRCEFAPCPQMPPADGFERMTYAYPPALPTQDISGHVWPPVVRVNNHNYVCVPGEREAPGTGLETTTEKKIGARTYCVSVITGAAAGSRYADYLYRTEQHGKLVTVAFTLRYTNCGVYEPPKMQRCEQEQQAFAVDQLVEGVISSMRIE